MGQEYDKLVRDEIPAIIEANGEKPVTHTADEAEYERRLLDKLAEEVEEYRAERDVEELADVLEVVYAICAHRNVSRSELERLRAKKTADRGRFDERIVLERVES